MDVRARIYSYYPSLTKSEQKVADAVLERNVDLIYHSVTELSEFAEVGETTIMRFCRKIGFKGYQDFKLALAQDKAYQNPDQPDSGNGEEETARGVYRHAVQALDTCLSLLDKDKLQKAVDLIDVAGHVQFLGWGHRGLPRWTPKTGSCGSGGAPKRWRTAICR
ncbi:MurR/RpiR family transcriptional regulator [Paenibacillus sp. CC-CFT747]|nr:MurR/RpiR family transcriptional regulator [Paenibacillus sp. CC-CFT747]